MSNKCLKWVEHRQEVKMPKVGKKKFSYTKKGKTAARKHAAKTGKKMRSKKY